MTTIPFYSLIVLPGETYYFSGEYFQSITGEEVSVGEELVFLMLREEKERGDIVPDDFFPIGVTGTVDSITSDGDLCVKALQRVDVTNMRLDESELRYSITPREEIEDMPEEEMEQRFAALKSAYMHFAATSQWGMMMRGFIMQWKSLNELVSSVSLRLAITNEEKYAILAEDRVSERFSMMEKACYEMLEIMKVSSEAESAQAQKNEKLYREDAIRKQIEFLQNELEQMNPESISDVARFEQAIAASGMNETALKEAQKVLGRMKQEGHNSSEYGLLYDYLDFVTGLEWKCPDMPEIDLKEAQEILDEDHYGLEKVKRRVLEQIAVMDLNRRQSGSILLFVGAPGTGKTSIGQSIAKALHRKYVRVSLGGVRDEAEIRGHRRTYIGAMPGRIMDGIKKCGAANPVMVLDEVDKLSHDYNGDPASALLEVLDPEQNSTFTDHYMNVPYDLSNVLFVCTANTLSTIPEPLLNRMEVIEFPGYTATEKLQIARRHLLPRAMKAAGLKANVLKVKDETIEKIIADYTAESGVRGLKKQLDTVCRTAAVRLVRGDCKSMTVTPKKLKEYIERKPIRHDRMLDGAAPGVVTGLAWTAAGGEILYIETMFTKGSGKILITGQLGNVMKESVQIAITLVKHLYPESETLFKENDLHVHVPEGAVPKDGPSAGITLTTALTSLVTGTAVPPTLAMTGEISLRGLVMPIGGLNEKLMAAVRAGLTTVLIPAENEPDLEEVAGEVRSKLTIHPVRTLAQVLRYASLPETM